MSTAWSLPQTKRLIIVRINKESNVDEKLVGTHSSEANTKYV